MGVPHVRTGRRGDLICVVRVVVPSHLSHEDRTLYEQLEGRGGKPAEVKKGFFDSLRDAFRA
jgi:DnaJ-class molecular chaperone